MKRLYLDWRGVPNLSASADLYSVAATHEKRPETGNPQGRILVGISPTIYYQNGLLSDRPYNRDLAVAAARLGATFTDKPRVVWEGMNGGSTLLFDLTKRGMLKAWLEILDQHFPWADGFHIDYFSAWSWAFPDLADSDQKWDDLLGSLAATLRSKGKLVLGQQFHLTNPLMHTNGAFVEQSPYAFRMTLRDHEADMNNWRGFLDRVMGPRENIWTYEVREWQNWPKASLDLVKRWIEDNDCYGCFGRDANVMP